MSRPLLFAHGWGYDRTVWDRVVALLPGRRAFHAEAGYLGAVPDWPAAPEGAVLVGHSAGVLSLLRHGVPPGCGGLVAINGFSRFAAAEGFPGVPVRVLARMRQGFAVSPIEVLRSFRARCGDEAAPETVDAAALAEGLRALHDEDEREALRIADIPVLALAAQDDPIVSPAHAIACFGKRLRWSATGGHRLPSTRPDWCAAMIDTFAC